ncbi:MAG: hypothetical protein C4518_10310 [Desulfobacteraceae bacterium]|nr:MAG: hypothetical protein C4518_10310 [Desulfobacteraceae bacterium]
MNFDFFKSWLIRTSTVSLIKVMGLLIIFLAVSTWLPLTALADNEAAATYPVRTDPAITDDDWVSMNPEIPGTNGAVWAMAIHGNDIYVCGYFTAAGGVVANRIAKWDGTSWSALGSGIGDRDGDTTVNALAVDGAGNLYAGGIFDTAGGVAVKNIAKWDGASWSALGSGIDGEVKALAVDDAGNLYAGGRFTTAGGVSVNYIAKWDGTSWSSLGSGMGRDDKYFGSVSALALDDAGNLYAGGYFTTAGGVAAKNIARWDGADWSALGNGTSNSVGILAMDGAGNLYAGGWFHTAGGVPANNIAKWDGTSWSSLGSGIDGEVKALAVDGAGNLYAGGQFIAKWDGARWSALGSGMDGPPSGGPVVKALAADSEGNLYAGGRFDTAGGVPAKNIAKWDSVNWSSLGSNMLALRGVDGGVAALAADGGDLYAGGKFTTAGGVPVNGIAKWDGTSWNSLGSGFGDRDWVDYTVNALAVDGAGNLYAAAGYFMAHMGEYSNDIAKWDGTNWSSLGFTAGVPFSYDIVNALAVDGAGNLYAGGEFEIAGGVAAKNIAKWDGTSWSSLGSGIGDRVGDAEGAVVLALAVDGAGNLYAGGVFETAGGVAVYSVAKWDGAKWNDLGSDFFSYDNSWGFLVVEAVYTLAVDGAGNLYAGGSFETAGGVPANNIAKWDGARWSALGSGVGGYDDYVYALRVDGAGNLYAGGLFYSAGEVPANHIAKWDGTNWSALGSGTGGSVNALAVDDVGALYVGGYFTTAGNKVSPYIAKCLIPYTINFQINDAFPGAALNGQTSQVIHHGENGTPVTAIAPAGHAFWTWTLAGAAYSTVNPLTVTNVERSMTLTAVFGLARSLTYTAGAGGIISGVSPQVVANGASGTAVTAVPDSGYRFVQWSDGVTVNPRTDAQVTADISVTAQYEPKKSGGGGGGCFVGALAR